jgi:hypothetical protein
VQELWSLVVEEGGEVNEHTAENDAPRHWVVVDQQLRYSWHVKPCNCDDPGTHARVIPPGSTDTEENE